MIQVRYGMTHAGIDSSCKVRDVVEALQHSIIPGLVCVWQSGAEAATTDLITQSVVARCPQELALVLPISFAAHYVQRVAPSLITRRIAQIQTSRKGSLKRLQRDVQVAVVREAFGLQDSEGIFGNHTWIMHCQRRPRKDEHRLPSLPGALVPMQTNGQCP